MTTTVTITNEGPERAAVFYYDENRQLQKHATLLKKGESVTVNVWNGCIPWIQAVGLADKVLTEPPSFYSVPPAHY